MVTIWIVQEQLRGGNFHGNEGLQILSSLDGHLDFRSFLGIQPDVVLGNDFDSLADSAASEQVVPREEGKDIVFQLNIEKPKKIATLKLVLITLLISLTRVQFKNEMSQSRH